MDITRLSSKELAALISEAQKRKRVLAKRKPINQVRAQVNKIVRGSGYTFAELFGSNAASAPATSPAPRKASTAKPARKKLPPVEPKYRDPANPANTWSGRGKQPRWLATYTSQGRNLADFLIASTPATAAPAASAPAPAAANPYSGFSGN